MIHVMQICCGVISLRANEGFLQTLYVLITFSLMLNVGMHSNIEICTVLYFASFVNWLHLLLQFI